MGGIEADNGNLRHGYRLRGRGEATGDVAAANGGLEAAECDVRRYFGGGKGAALEIQQVWRGQRRQGIIRVWCRD